VAVAGLDDDTPSILLPAVVQAASTAEAAASEKLRRP
jgi:hypothetical protein